MMRKLKKIHAASVKKLYEKFIIKHHTGNDNFKSFSVISNLYQNVFYQCFCKYVGAFYHYYCCEHEIFLFLLVDRICTIVGVSCSRTLHFKFEKNITIHSGKFNLNVTQPIHFENFS